MIATLLMLITLVPGYGLIASWQSPEESPETVEFVVEVLPPMANISFELDGQTRTTGADGKAVFNVAPLADGELDPELATRVKLTADDGIVQLDDRSRARFSRWRVGSARTGKIIAQFSLEYQVEFQLFDTSTPPLPVPLSRIDVFELKSSVGEVIEWRPALDDPPWLLGVRIPGETLIEEKQVFWTVRAAYDSGLLVVNRNQTKFFPDEQPVVRVEPVLYFSANFEVVDAFFGFHTGEAVIIETPDGEEALMELSEGRLTLGRLARGDYVVTVTGGGLEIPRPVSISRNQSVTLKLYTTLDLIVVGAVAMTFLVTPIYLGIRRRRPRDDGRHRRATRVAEAPVVPRNEVTS